MPQPPSEPTASAAEPSSTTPVRARSPLPLLAVPCTSPSPVLPLPRDWTTDMVHTRGGHRYKPRVKFSTLEIEDAGTSKAADAYYQDLSIDAQPALAPAAIPEEPQASKPPFRRYQTRMGPRAPSPVPQRRRRRAQPSKRSWTSGPGESSRSRPEPSPPPVDEVHRPGYHWPRGSGAPCSLVIRFRGTWICMPGTFIGSYITIYQR